MISTLTVSGSLIVSGGLTVNEIARKENLVVHLEASPSTYTAHPFNSDISRTGLSATVLNWPNRWNDLSGNNNHAYPCTTIGAYTSSANFPLTASYLNNNIYFNNSLNNFRLNPIQETTGPLSVFIWVRRKGAGGSGGQWLINKRQVNFTASDTYYHITFSTTPAVNIAINNRSAGLVFNSSAISNNIWYNIGFTVEDVTPTSRVTAYLNGVAYGTSLMGGTGMPVGSKEVIMGRQAWAAAGNANADMSQVLIYNTCLTPQEVWNNYQITKYKHQT
jgi:hypothetical protein